MHAEAHFPHIVGIDLRQQYKYAKVGPYFLCLDKQYHKNPAKTLKSYSRLTDGRRVTHYSPSATSLRRGTIRIPIRIMGYWFSLETFSEHQENMVTTQCNIAVFPNFITQENYPAGVVHKAWGLSRTSIFSGDII